VEKEHAARTRIVGARSPERGYLFAARPGDRALAPIATFEEPGVPGFGASASFDVTATQPDDADDEVDGGASAAWVVAPLVIAGGDATRPGALFTAGRSADDGGGAAPIAIAQVAPDLLPSARLYDVRPGGPLLVASGGRGKTALYPQCLTDGGYTWTTLTDGIDLLPAK
jgi:hypothetical protein